jgi:hypothetical protein
MINLFEEPSNIDPKNIVCNSGGADGSDTIFETKTIQYGGKVNAYSYKTKKHISPNKVEISDDDYQEGIEKVKTANLTLKRWGIEKYMNLLARNWVQVKYSDQIIAIGTIIDPGKKDSKGYYSKSSTQIVSGGTGYAVTMAIDEKKPVYVFDQVQCSWFRWSYTTNSFIKCSIPKLVGNNFAGIGTREINEFGIRAIDDFFNYNFPTN